MLGIDDAGTVHCLLPVWMTHGLMIIGILFSSKVVYLSGYFAAVYLYM